MPTTLCAAPTVPLTPPAASPGPARVVAAVLAVVGGVATVVGLYVVAVLDPAGRAVDQSLMREAMGVGLRSEGLALLGLVGVPSVAVAVAALAGVALARRRTSAAVGVTAIVLGSGLVTQVLKVVLVRPDSTDVNSLPSGHVTLVASLGVALVLVVPRVVRPLAGALAGTLTVAAGAATMVAGWHRPSDVVAAVGVVAVTTGLVGILSAVRGRPRSA